MYYVLRISHRVLPVSWLIATTQSVVHNTNQGVGWKGS